MGRSEFADPPVTIVLDSNIIQTQCSSNPVGCACGNGDYTKPSQFVAKGYDSTSTLEETDNSEHTETHFVLSGKICLLFEPKLKDPNEVKPTLEITFTGREHLDLTTAADITSTTSLPAPTTREFLKITQTQPWKERSTATTVGTTEYDFRLLIPRALPPTALPEKGAIDYRIEAVFHLPEKAGYDELVAQRRIEIVRTHINFDGPTVPGPPVNRPVITAAGTQPIYAVSIQAPEYAFIDSGILPVTITLLQGPIKKIQTVVLTVEERRKYALVKRNPTTNKLTRTVATDSTTLGEKVITNVGEIQKGHLSSVQLKFGNGVAGAAANGKIPILVHPSFSGETIFVSHVLIVKIVYGESEVVDTSGGAVGNPKSGLAGMHGLFKKLTHNVGGIIPGQKDEEFETPLLLRTGVMHQ